jgi:hypothetical protein
VSRAQLIYLNLSIALTALTGIVFAAMKYFLKSEDPFAAANHPLQPHALSAHVVLAPFAVFAFGWVFANHIWPKLVYGNGARRASGVWSMVMIVPMALSGYLMQISTNETILKAMTIAHWIASGLFVVVYVVHLLKRPAPAAV